MTNKKSSGFNISSLVKPINEILIDGVTIYLYTLRTSDITAFQAISKEEQPLKQLRQFLGFIASRSIHDDFETERISLDSAFIDHLSDEDIEKIAEAYLSTDYARNGLCQGTEATLQRAENEAASSFLIKLFNVYIENDIKNTKRMFDQVLTPFSSIFDQVRKSSADLDGSLNLFKAYSNALKSPPTIFANDGPSFVASNAMRQHSEKIAKERADELEMFRLTGEMTAQSARLLKDLSDAASTFLEQSEERSIRENKTTKLQLWIAAWSLIVSAVLSAVSLYFSIVTYHQALESSLSSDNLQQKLIESINENTKSEQQTLKLQEKALDLQIEKHDALKKKNLPPNH